MQNSYNAGVKVAEEKFGAECREFDRAIWGVTAAMNANGRGVTEREVVNRWHYPLASAAPHYNGLDNWRKAFPGVWKGYNETKLGYESRELFSGRAVYHGRTSAYDVAAQVRLLDNLEHIDKRAADLFDSEVKRAHPGIRKNSKRYKQLADEKRELAREIIRGDIRKEVRRLAAEFSECADRETKWLAKPLDDAARLAEVAADLRALNPGCQVADEVAAIADRLRSRAEQRLAELAAERLQVAGLIAEPVAA